MASDPVLQSATDLLARLRRCGTVGAIAAGEVPADVAAEAADEIARLRALVKRLTDVAENLAGELSDPGSEALAAIYCGRHLIYG